MLRCHLQFSMSIQQNNYGCHTNCLNDISIRSWFRHTYCLRILLLFPKVQFINLQISGDKYILLVLPKNAEAILDSENVSVNAYFPFIWILVCILMTGYNGTIDGQGQTWWKKYRQKLLNNTRGPLVQIMWSTDILISNITLRDSPFWTLHPYDCKNVTIRNVTILAPIFEAPNTDGIDPGKSVLWLCLARH